MASLGLEIKEPFEPTPSQSSERSPLKKYFVIALILIFSLTLILFLNFYPPAKIAIVNAGYKIKSLGLLGDILIILISGVILIPLCVPHVIFTMVFSLVINNYFEAVMLFLLSDLVGNAVIYILTKKYIHTAVNTRMKNNKLYRGIELMLSKNPFKFSIIIRLTILPSFMKSYGLAVYNSISFVPYVTAGFIGLIPRGFLEIYVFQNMKNMNDILSGNRGGMYRMMTVGIVLVSIMGISYLVFYTQKVLKDIGEETKSSRANIEFTEYRAEHEEVLDKEIEL